jgi:hypothetical protein
MSKPLSVDEWWRDWGQMTRSRPRDRCRRCGVPAVPGHPLDREYGGMPQHSHCPADLDPLKPLGLSTMTRNCLGKVGVWSVEELQTIPDEVLLSIRGLAKKGLAEIRAAVERYAAGTTPPEPRWRTVGLCKRCGEPFRSVSGSALFCGPVCLRREAARRYRERHGRKERSHGGARADASD